MIGIRSVAKSWKIEYFTEANGFSFAFDVVWREHSEDSDTVGYEAEVYQVSLERGIQPWNKQSIFLER
jgi:hypothetical protein